MKRFLGILALIGVILSGCTGSTLTEVQQYKLQDLYTASVGLWAHYRLGQWMTEWHNANGAKETYVELKMPFSKKRADFVAVYHNRTGLDALVYEFKPITNSSGTRLEAAKLQVGGYIDLLLKSKRLYYRVIPGRKFQAEGKYVVVPHKFTPELRARCMEMRVRTYETLAPGVVFYYISELQGNIDGRTCGKRDKDEKSRDIGGFIGFAATTVIPRNYSTEMAQLRMIQLYSDGEIAGTKETFWFPYAENEEPDTTQRTIESSQGDAIHKYLMGLAIPVYFKVAPPSTVPVPGQSEPNRSWECKTYDCA